MSSLGKAPSRPGHSAPRTSLLRFISLLAALSLIGVLPAVASAESGSGPGLSADASQPISGDLRRQLTESRIVGGADAIAAPARKSAARIQADIDRTHLAANVAMAANAAEIRQELDTTKDKVSVMVVARSEIRGSDKGRVDEVLEELSGTDSEVVKVAEALPVVTAEIDQAGLNALTRSPAVEGIQLVTAVESHIDETTSLTGLDDLQNMGVTAGPNLGFARWDVAVIDSGIRRTHRLVAGRVASEWCFRSDATCPNGGTVDSGPGSADPEGNFHGTHVAATAMGSYNGTYVGAAPGARVHAIKVLDGQGSGSSDDILAALDKVHQLVVNENQRIAAVNLSLGTNFGWTSESRCAADNPAFVAAVQRLRQAGVLVIASAGNSGTPEAIGAPACIPGVVSVGNTTDNDTVNPTSSSANYLDIWAPGTDVQSAHVANDTALASSTGTSMSSPHVAGAAAMLYSCASLNHGGPSDAFPNRDDTIEALLTGYGTDVTDDRPRNYGPVTKKRLEMRAIADGMNPNNRFGAAVNLDGFAGQVSDTNSCATREVGEPAHLGANRASVWFRHSAKATADLVLSLCSTNKAFDSNITVFIGNSVSTLTAVGGNDDGCGASGSLSRLVVPVQRGLPYRVAVTSDSGSGAPFLLQWSYQGVSVCNNRVATWTGTSGDDTFTGGPGVDVIVAGDGNDVIDGGGGNDHICLGNGADVGRGGDGDDFIFGGEGFDAIYAGPGNDMAHGGGGNDRIFGGPGDDELRGVNGRDIMNGDIGDDQVYGGYGDDIMWGSLGNDEMWGGPGDDDVRGQFGADRIWGEAGEDSLNGGNGNDFVIGGLDNDLIWGADGQDDLRGANGWDRILGGPGHDTLNGGNGNDVLAGESGDDTLIGGQGNDNLRGAGGNDTLNGGLNQDYCHGGNGADTHTACETRLGFP